MNHQTRLILTEFVMDGFLHLSPVAEILLVQRVPNVSSEAASYYGYHASYHRHLTVASALPISRSINVIIVC